MVPDTHVIDAQFNLTVPKWKSTIKVGATTSFLDCVYQVASAETVTVTNASIGATGINGPFNGLTTDVRRLFCNIQLWVVQVP